MFGRRALLRGVGTAVVVAPLLAACDLLDRDPPVPPAPDALADFHAQTLILAAQYDAVIASSPDLAATLIPIRDAHRAHAGALAAIMNPAPSAAASAAPSAPPAADPATLKLAEAQAQQKAIEVCLAAPANRATLLAEIAAARACHLEVMA